MKEAKDRAAAAAPLQQPAGLPQQQPAVDVGTKRPGMEGSAGDADAKRLRTAATEGGSGAGSALTSNYAAAAAAAEGAPTGGDAEDAEKQAKLNPLAVAADPLLAAGVDVSAEDRGAEIVAREGGDDEAARFGSGAMGVQLRTKLSEMSRRFGLAEGADEGACRVVAVALQERIASMIEDLRPAVRQRTNSAKHAFGQDAFTKGTDPKLSWKVRAAQTKAPTSSASSGASSGAPMRAGGGSVAAETATSSSAEERRLESLTKRDAPASTAAGAGLSLAAAAAEAAAANAARDAAAAAAEAAREVVANAADVLYVLDTDRQSSRSRVVQWWKCNNGPLVRYARQSARLFPPPPAGSS